MKLFNADGTEKTASSAASGVDEKTKVTASDTTAGYLASKVVADDASVVLTVNNPAANETLGLKVGVLQSDASHGTRGGGTTHAVVVAAGAAGFMSGSDKTKLDGIATGATANTGDVVGPASAVSGNLTSFSGTTGKLVADSGVTASSVSSHIASTSNPHSTTAAQVGAVATSAVGAASGVASLNASSKVVQDPASATATPTATSIPISGAGGKLAVGWLSAVLASSDLTNDAALEKTANKGAASGYASLNASSKVVQDPASATATPTATSIPISGAGGKLAVGWMSAVLASSDLTNDAALEKTANKGAASGYASLDATTKVPIAQVPTGSTATTVCIGNDARLSDARTPTAHSTSHKHGGTDEVASATAGANLIPKAGAGGTLASGWISGVLSSAGLTNDAALEKTANKGAASGYASLDGTTKVPIAQLPTGSTASTVTIGNDARLSDARTPTAHATSHVTGGSDVIPNVVAAGNSGLMTGADKTKLDGIATGATANTGDVVGPASAVAGNIPTFSGTTGKLIADGGVAPAALERTANKGAASGYASLDASSKVVQDPVNATATATASKIPIADASAKLDTWVTYRPGGTDVAIADGGTGASTKTAAFDALSPTAAKGDLAVHNGTNNVVLPVGANNFVLTADSAAATGVKWAAAGASGTNIVEVEVDFGTAPTRSKSFTITDGSITAAQQIQVNQSLAAATGRSQDENEMDTLLPRAVAGTGQFTMFVTALEGPVVGKFKFNYLAG